MATKWVSIVNMRLYNGKKERFMRDKWLYMMKNMGQLRSSSLLYNHPFLFSSPQTTLPQLYLVIYRCVHHPKAWECSLHNFNGSCVWELWVWMSQFELEWKSVHGNGRGFKSMSIEFINLPRDVCIELHALVTLWGILPHKPPHAFND
jgi:hypothetical protein